MKKIILAVLVVLLHSGVVSAADTKTTALTENTTPLITDLAYIVDDPGGTPLGQKITIGNILNSGLITTLGTITTGVWNGTALVDAYVADTITASSYEPLLTNSAGLLGALNDETGTGVAVFGTSPTLATPILTGKQDRNNGTVNDDDCTGEQGMYWYDNTDSSFEFCNANSGAPIAIAASSGDITSVGDCLTGACTMDAAMDNENITPTAGTWDLSAITLTLPNITSVINTGVGLDGIGAVDLDYGSADITDHTFVTDGTGTAEVVLPAGSIDSTEILDGTIAGGDLSSSLNLVTTGTINGLVTTTSTTAATLAMTAAQCAGDMHVNGDNDVIDYTLPAAADGLTCCFYALGNASVITVDANDGIDTIYLNGASVGAGDAIDSAGGAGDFICLLAVDVTNWHTLGRSGTWIDGGVD